MNPEKDDDILKINLSELEIAKSQFPEYKEIEALKPDAAFESELNEAEDKMEFLEKEIRQIDANLETFKHTMLEDFVVISFNSNYEFSEEIDLSQKKYTRIQLVGIYIGKVLSDYKKMVEAKRIELEKKIKEKYKFNINEQLLILSYFGILQSITTKNTNEKSAELLAGILNKNSQDIRDQLGRFERTIAPSEKKQMETLKAKLDTIRKIFNEYHLDRIVTQIEKDIKRVENKLNRKM